MHLREQDIDRLIEEVLRKLDYSMREGYSARKLVEELEKVNAKLDAISLEMEKLLNTYQRIFELCELASSRLSKADNFIAERIKRLPVVSVDYLCQLIGFDLRKITPRYHEVIVSILQLSKAGLEPHKTNISDKMRIRRGPSFHHILERAVKEGLLEKIQGREKDGKGRPPTAVYRVSDRILELLGQKIKPITDSSKLLKEALFYLNCKKLLAFPIPQKAGKSLPDGAAVPPMPKADSWDWTRIMAVEVESEDELRDKKKHIAALIVNRIMQGYSKVIIVCQRNYKSLAKEVVEKTLKELYPKHYENLRKRTRILPL